MGKKETRLKFKNDVFKRDKHTCQVCKTKRTEEELDAHHITKIFDVFIISRYLLI